MAFDFLTVEYGFFLRKVEQKKSKVFSLTKTNYDYEPI